MATLFETAMRGYSAADDMIKKSQAYQAAREQYGVGPASDPGLFSALQGYELAANQDRRSQQQLEMSQQSASRQQQVHDFTMTRNEQTSKEDGILNLVQGLRQARDEGQDIGAAFDKFSENLPNLGVDPADIPAMRESLVADPSMLDSYYAALTGKTSDSATGSTSSPGTASATDPVKAAKERQVVSETVATMRELYARLDERGGITNPEVGAIANFSRAASQSPVGRFVGRVSGGRNESLRRTIEGLRPGLIASMKAAEGLGSRMFDSNKDMELWMSMVTDPNQDMATVQNLLNVFESRYGAAAAGQPVPKITMENYVGNENYQRSNGTDLDQIYPGFVDPASGLSFQGGDPGDPANWQEPAAPSQ